MSSVINAHTEQDEKSKRGYNVCVTYSKRSENNSTEERAKKWRAMPL